RNRVVADPPLHDERASGFPPKDLEHDRQALFVPVRPSVADPHREPVPPILPPVIGHREQEDDHDSGGNAERDLPGSHRDSPRNCGATTPGRRKRREEWLVSRHEVAVISPPPRRGLPPLPRRGARRYRRSPSPPS